MIHEGRPTALRSLRSSIQFFIQCTVEFSRGRHSSKHVIYEALGILGTECYDVDPEPQNEEEDDVPDRTEEIRMHTFFPLIRYRVDEILLHSETADHHICLQNEFGALDHMLAIVQKVSYRQGAEEREEEHLSIPRLLMMIQGASK